MPTDTESYKNKIQIKTQNHRHQIQGTAQISKTQKIENAAHVKRY